MGEDERRTWGSLAARGTVALGRGIAKWIPGGLRRRLEDRFFDAVGHATRVTNDGYPQPKELVPPPGPRPAEEGAPDGPRQGAVRRSRPRATR